MSIMIGIGNIESVSFDETSKSLSVTYTDGHIDSVDISSLDKSTAITAETGERKTADSALSGRITAEVADRKSADDILDNAISEEASRAKEAESANADSISSVKSTSDKAAEDIASLQTALGTETTRATNAESTLTSSIESVKTTADNAASAISTEKDRAISAENTLDTRVTANSTSISNEVSRATNAESANASAISAETSRATTAEDALTRTTNNASGLAHRFYKVDGQPVSGKEWCMIANVDDYISAYNTIELSFFYTYDYAGVTPNAFGFVTFRLRQNGSKTGFDQIALTQVQLRGETEQTFKANVYQNGNWYCIEIYAKLSSWTKVNIFGITTFENKDLTSSQYQNESWYFCSNGYLTSSNTWTDGTTQNVTNTVRSVIFSDTYTIDSTPTSGSNNLVKSGGVYTAVNNAVKGTKAHIYEIDASEWAANPSSATYLSLGYTKCVLSVTSADSYGFIRLKTMSVDTSDYEFIDVYFRNKTSYSLYVLQNDGTSYASYEVAAGETQHFIVFNADPYTTLRIS